jgi:hypothetical protein
MDFGTIFISLIAFTIAALVLPVYIAENIKRNVRLLGEQLRRDYALEALAPETGDFEKAKRLWEFLVDQEVVHRIRWVRKQHHVPFVTGALVLEVLIFAAAAYRIARGGKTPGAIEDVVVGLSFLLIGMSVYIAYRAIETQGYFRGYFSAYEEYTALWRRHGTARDQRSKRTDA